MNQEVTLRKVRIACAADEDLHVFVGNLLKKRVLLQNVSKVLGMHGWSP
jgi:hypothetical protein